MRKGQQRWQVHLIMLFCAFLVSSSFTVGKAIAGDMDPAVLTLFRFVVAVCLLLPYFLVTKTLSCSVSLFFRSALISFSLVLFFWSMFWALRFTSAFNTSVIFTLVPAISGLYALILIRERLSRARLLSLVCGMIGAILVLFRGDLAAFLALTWNRGDLIFLGGCFAMGFYTPLVKLLYREGQNGESLICFTFWILVTAALWLILLAGPKLVHLHWAMVPGRVWLGIVYLALFTTVISFFLTQYSIPHLGATRVISYSYLYPVFVVLLDFLGGHGWPEAQVIPGILLVLLAMVLMQRDDCEVRPGGRGLGRGA